MCLVLSLILIAASPQHVVAEKYAVGTKHSGVLTLDTPGEVKVVLPAGEWEVVTNIKLRNNVNAPYTILSLIQTEEQRVTQGIRILSFSESGSGFGYVPSPLCIRRDLHHKKVYANYEGGEQDCYALMHYTPTLQGSKNKYDNAVGDLLIAKNIKWGLHFPTSFFRFADSYEVLEVWYIVDPVKYGFRDYEKTPWIDSPWHRDGVRGDPEKKRFIEALKGWMEAAYPTVKQGWKNKLPANAKLPEFRFGPSSDALTQADMNRDDASVCGEALNKSGDGWAEATFPKSVKIAMRRGYKPENCKSIVSAANMPATTLPRAAAGQKMEENSSPESKLERIKNLLERGLITEDDAADKRKDILKNM